MIARRLLPPADVLPGRSRRRQRTMNWCWAWWAVRGSWSSWPATGGWRLAFEGDPASGWSATAAWVLRYQALVRSAINPF